MKKIDLQNIKNLPIASVLFASTSMPNHEMYRTLILDTWNLPQYIDEQINYNDVVVVEGFHWCSYSFNDTKWEAISYTQEEFLKLCVSFYKDHEVWQQAKEYFENN